MWLGHVLRRKSLLHDIIEGRTRGKATRLHLLRDLVKGKYLTLKRIAKDRKEWQKLKRAGSYIHLLLSRLLKKEEALVCR